MKIAEVHKNEFSKYEYLHKITKLITALLASIVKKFPSLY
jgi:hypothetical protein